MPNLRSHKRGRSVDQRLICNFEQRLIAASRDVDSEEARSDSEYDSDVIVVGKGRQYPRVSKTPHNHTPSSMRTLPPSPTSSQEAVNGPVPEPALVEWHP
jgi:hypothetical protein